MASGVKGSRLTSMGQEFLNYPYIYVRFRYFNLKLLCSSCSIGKDRCYNSEKASIYEAYLPIYEEE